MNLESVDEMSLACLRGKRKGSGVEMSRVGVRGVQCTDVWER